jgi:hypothetical protein
MSDINAILEAERRGILPPENIAALQEARKRGLIDPQGAIQEAPPPAFQQAPGPGVPIPGVPFPTPAEEFGEIRQAPPESISQTIVRGISNIPESAINYLQTTVSAFTSPLQTAKSLGMVAEGAIQSLIPGEDPSEEASDAVLDHFKKRYGGIEELKETFATDPVGFMADVSFIMGIGGSSIAKISKAGGRIQKIARTTAKVGRALDPLHAAGIAISKPVKAAGKVGAIVLGKLTGRGPIAIQEAFKNAPELVKGLTGETDMTDVLASAQGGIQNMADSRRVAYRSTLAKIKKATVPDIDIMPIRKKLTKWFDEDHFNIRVSPEGVLDSSRSVLSGRALKEAEEIWNAVLDWGRNADDFTPLKMDVLKRKLDKFWTSTSDSRAMVADLRNEVKNQIVKKVPEYERLTKNYSKAMRVQSEIEKTLSLGSRANPDTAIRKLNTILKTDNNFRRDLIKTLSDNSGIDIQAAIAGTQLNQIGPQGLIGNLTDFGAVATMLRMGQADPGLLLLIAGSSPKVVGQTMRLLGGTTRAVGKTGRAIGQVTPAAFQVGRIKGIVSRQQPQLSELE